MKKTNILLAFMLFIFAACSDFVNDVDPFYDRVTDDVLTLDSQIAPLATGMITLFNESASRILLMSDGLSDILVWDQRLPNATYGAFRQLEETLLDESNGSTNFAYTKIQEARSMAEGLIDRIENELTSVSVDYQAEVDDAHFKAYLYSGYTRYLLGTYYGKDGTTGGSPIDNSALITTSELYAEAKTNWEKALTMTTDANFIKIIHSLIGRCHFFLGEYAEALDHLNQGLTKGDEPFIAEYDITNSGNYYREQASSEARIQWRLDDRFKVYTAADPSEANRIKWKFFKAGPRPSDMAEQTVYLKGGGNIVTPIPLIDWYEVAMMKAEMIVRGTGSGDALALINEVRASQSVNTLPAGTVVDANTFYVEREKALFLRGLRLIDQRRYNSFHTSFGWVYFSIPLLERLKNPNYN